VSQDDTTRRPIAPTPTPRIASYRIQLTPTFGFADTIGLLDHLVSVGISHLYLSPVAEAVPGSLHGYDVIDHTRVRAEFGGEAGLFELLDRAAEMDLGVVIDHVPNHMSAAEAHLNDRWWEMLRDGPSSPSARWFDVDWDAADGRVIVPKLGDPIDEVFANGALTVGEGDRGAELRYGPLRFPMASGTEDLPVADAVERQHYRLQWWRDPQRNVRRFFTIDDLVAVRAEEPAVAEVIDTLPARLADHPAFAGVRVDHVDGLAQPEAYLAGLRQRIGDHRWLLVEKILAPGETLPPSWPVDGTTGYEHIRVSEHAFLDPAAEEPLTRLWTDLTADERSFAEVEDTARREVLVGGLAPDLDRLVRTVMAGFGSGDQADLVDAVDADAIDGDRVRAALVELTIGVHRYRTYLPDDAASVIELDDARRRAVAARADLADVIDAVATLIRIDPAVATRWEQLTSPVMAKGAEDRAFYRYLRLPSLCEVGGAPGEFSTAVDEFHRHHAEVQALMPTTMLAGTTHDTKRSEGVRSRSLALAEIADDWAATARAWMDEHDHHGLDAATVLLALHTSVAAWPIDADRLSEYLLKSAREAELHTSWTDPDEAYEAALRALATDLETQLLGGDGDSSSGDGDGAGVRGDEGDVEVDGGGDLGTIVTRTLRPGWARSLALLGVRLTAPGVPDLYQGTVSFTYSLVDPDNRVEPDWDERRALVAAAATLDGPGAWLGDDAEAAKAVVVTRTLALRRRRAGAFGPTAGYLPLEVTGTHADRVVAFARAASGESGEQPAEPAESAQPAVVTVVSTRSAASWGDTAVVLPTGTWRNVLVDDGVELDGGTPVAVAEWFDGFPLAVLERTDA
jgi:(1->4)-alpha-D-glucan 1-alpha-D-glucosylmutase